MKIITSTVAAAVIASFASVSVANESKGTELGFTNVDKHAAESTYGKRADRKRDLTRI